jgi:hypothetical protein
MIEYQNQVCRATGTPFHLAPTSFLRWFEIPGAHR